MAYRYPRFGLRVALQELRAIGAAVRPGEVMPLFDLPTIDGGRARAEDFLGRPLVVVFASYT